MFTRSSHLKDNSYKCPIISVTQRPPQKKEDKKIRHVTYYIKLNYIDSEKSFYVYQYI